MPTSSPMWQPEDISVVVRLLGMSQHQWDSTMALCNPCSKSFKVRFVLLMFFSCNPDKDMVKRASLCI